MVSVWGSDLYRAKNKNEILKTRKIYENADAITFFVDNATQKDFTIKFPQINKNKFHVCKFGSAHLNSLKKIINNNSNSLSKKFLELNNDKIVVTIGYNLHKEQNHIQIIENIIHNEDYQNYKDKIQFVFPITYP